MARVLFLHQYFPPDTAITGRQGQVIASALAAAGHDVLAIVGQPSYDATGVRAPDRETYEGVAVRRISTGRFRGRHSRFTRFGGYLVFLAGASLAALRARPDVVVTFHIPPFLPALGLLVARLRRARLVYVPQDIHPDILLESGWLRLPRPALAAWNGFNRMVLRGSDRVIALGEGMRRTLVAKGARPERVVVIPVWADPAFPRLGPDPQWRRAHGIPEDSLVALYAGNMGLMHPLDEVLSAAEATRGEGVQLVIAGDGVRRRHWEGELRRRGLGDVLMLPFQRGDDFRRLTAACDVALITLTPGMERLAVPSKPYPFLAAGRPVIAVASPEADIARDMATTGAGWQASDAAALGDLLRRLARDPATVDRAGEAARRLYEARYTPEQATGRYVELVREILA